MAAAHEHVEHVEAHPWARVSALAGIVFSPLIWLAHLVAVYVLTPLSCGGLSRFSMHLATAVALLAIAAVAGWGWVSGRRGAEAGVVATRGRFLAWVGLLVSAAMAVAVLMEEVAVWMIHPCVT
jgi:hypothetical protein